VHASRISDFDLAIKMLRYFIAKALRGSHSLFRPRIALCMPRESSEIERVVLEVGMERVARSVVLVDQAIAAPLGAGLPVHEARGSMLVDIGADTTNITVLSLNNVVLHESVKIGGNAMDAILMEHMRAEHRLLIGEPTAELIKMAVGAAHADYDFQEMRVPGRHVESNFPSSVVVNSAQVRAALNPVIQIILSSVRNVFQKVPPDIMVDLLEGGIMLCGGGSLLKGLDRRLAETLGVKVSLSPKVFEAGAKGAAIWMKERRCFSAEPPFCRPIISS